jgi:hypothetical protein
MNTEARKRLSFIKWIDVEVLGKIVTSNKGAI